MLQGCVAPSEFQRGLPYARASAILYDNDEVADVYTDDYLMALAAAEEIRLTGLTTSSSTAPYNRWVSSSDYERMGNDRLNSVSLARDMGWKHIPDPVRGPNRHLERPKSDRIEDTQPITSAGSWLVVNEANKATSDNPLVLIMGGPLTLAADAYLLDPSIADRIVVMWLGGGLTHMGGYNGWADPWAAYIVITQLRLMQFPEGLARPLIQKSRLRTELADSPLTEWMITKQLPSSIVNLPGEHDEDGPPAIALMRKDYVQEVRHVSYSHWEQFGDDVEPHEIPVFKDDPQGKAIVVTKANAAVATDEWWRGLKKALHSIPMNLP